MAILSSDQVLDQSNVETEEIDVPPWGGSVVVRGISKRKQRELRNLATDPRTDKTDGDELEKLIFLAGMHEPVFTEEQYERLLDSSAGIIDMLINHIMRVSHMNDDAIRKAQKSFSSRS